MKSGAFYANLTEAVERLVRYCMTIIKQQMKIVLEDAEQYTSQQGYR
ncbi:hypothetical protein [Bartonella queenslandensis]|nr:hypothetical protein [Bartonella queenslandensis]